MEIILIFLQEMFQNFSLQYDVANSFLNYGLLNVLRHHSASVRFKSVSYIEFGHFGTMQTFNKPFQSIP